MGVLSDLQIKNLNCIIPLEKGIKRENTISYGLTSYGYDVRAGYVFDVFDASYEPDQPVDPKNFDKKMLRRVNLSPLYCQAVKVSSQGMRTKNHEYVCEICNQPVFPDTEPKPCPKIKQPKNYVVIPPNSFALTETIETFNIPRQCLVIAMGKSTYARCGLVLNVTPGEPMWQGRWTIELSNTSPRPIKVYAGEGIGQMIFIRSAGVTDILLENVLEFAESLVDTKEKYPELAQIGQNFLDNLKNTPEKYYTCETSYEDKKGKYQSQSGLTYPKVDG